MNAHTLAKELYWFAGHTSSPIKDYSGFGFTGDFPPMNMYYAAVPFPDHYLVNFMLSVLCFQSFAN